MYTLVGGEVIFDVPLEKVYINLGYLKMTSPPPRYTLNIYMSVNIDFRGLFLKTREQKSYKNSFLFRPVFDRRGGLPGGRRGVNKLMYTFVSRGT